MIIDSYDINSEPIVKLENFYGEKQHLVKKCMVIFSNVIYEYMLEKFPCRQIAEVRACNGNIPFRIQYSFQNNNLAVFSSISQKFFQKRQRLCIFSVFDFEHISSDNILRDQHCIISEHLL